MVVDLLGQALSYLGGWILALFIPLLMGVLVGILVFNAVQHRTGWKWVPAAGFTLLLLWTLLFFLVNTSNLLNGLQNTDLSVIPPDVQGDKVYQDSQPHPILFFFRALFQSILGAFVFTILSFPFVFLGMMSYEWLSKRTKNVWYRLIGVAGIWSLLLGALLTAFPWILVGVIYLAFFGL
ncbi:MAG: hypothetical protein Q8P05_03280 [Candidatus Diapherotrites archaeon]|nr:hypothetical protein [Candidatus Diapherotrites archaeon]MDZ4255979.1 hypothetical protein [archaeon]